MARLNKDHIDYFFDYGLDMDNRTIYLGSAEYDEEGDASGVDFYMTEKFIKALHLLEKTGPNGDRPIHIMMNNPGGCMINGMAIYDAIKAAKNHVTITVYGDACSMGCIILQAADERILAPHSVVMFHEGYDGYNSNHPEIIRRWVKFNERYANFLDNILLTKIKEKQPDLKDKKFQELNVFDTIFTAQEAVDFGLADKILE